MYSVIIDIIDILSMYEQDEKNPIDSLALINLICMAYKVQNIDTFVKKAG